MPKALAAAILALAVSGWAGVADAATVPVPCDPTAKTKTSCIDSRAGQNGNSADVTEGAQPGAAGEAGGRADGLNGTKYGSAIADPGENSVSDAADAADSLITDETVPQGGSAGAASSAEITAGAVPESSSQSEEAALITDTSQTETQTMASAPVESAYSEPSDAGDSGYSSAPASPSIGNVIANGLANLGNSPLSPANDPAVQRAQAAAAARANGAQGYCMPNYPCGRPTPPAKNTCGGPGALTGC